MQICPKLVSVDSSKQIVLDDEPVVIDVEFRFLDEDAVRLFARLAQTVNVLSSDPKPITTVISDIVL